MIMKTLSLILFFLCISFSALHAQSLRDSISLEIVSFEDPQNVGHYTHVRVAIENHTKDFRYCFAPKRLLELGRYLRFTFEVECKDGSHRETNIIGIFEISDMKKIDFLPGERRESVELLFAICDIKHTSVFKGYFPYNLSDVTRLRFFNTDDVLRIPLDDNDYSFYPYSPGALSSDWYDLTTPDFDFLRK